MLGKMRYRLALDLGTTSLGWAMIRLNKADEPCAVIKAGVRIFSDGRNSKDGTSLAVTRREARGQRRRRDRLLKRKARMITILTQYGLFPHESQNAQRKKLEILDPYFLRAKGLDTSLTPFELGRAIFHLNQRRGFKSNRKTDKKENEIGPMKIAISQLRERLGTENHRTVGEYLYKRFQTGETVRNRRPEGEKNKKRTYAFYIERKMIEDEFDLLWKKQSEFNPILLTEAARCDIKNVLLYQRNLKPVDPGRCTLYPEEKRALRALPSSQNFALFQSLNHLRILRGLKEDPLSLEQRNIVAEQLEKCNGYTFKKIKKCLKLDESIAFNFEKGSKPLKNLKGNLTSAVLSQPDYFGIKWFEFNLDKQDKIVEQLMMEEDESKLIEWLKHETGVDEKKAQAILEAKLPEGYMKLSRLAITEILNALRLEVITYDKAVKAAGFNSHSELSSTGEIWEALPYYGKALPHRVSLGSGDEKDIDEKRYGKIANPTVHIGLNQVRLVVNQLIKRYGHPSEMIVELARDLKLNKEKQKEISGQQNENNKRNERIRDQILKATQVKTVSREDIKKVILWEELSTDVAERACPYSGRQISFNMLFNGEVEVDHILPFSRTLDDSLNNKTIVLREANRIKGDRTPWEAFGSSQVEGYDYMEIIKRAEKMPKAKGYRFAEDGYECFIKGNDFLARALNDTSYMSKIALEYLTLICPANNTRSIPGRLTAMLREKLGLNEVLGLKGEKNRDDHRHHAVDACVIAVTDQALLQRFAQASASARKQQLNRLISEMPLPWENYRKQVERSVNCIWVSYKPDHGHEGMMHRKTAYGFTEIGEVRVRDRKKIGLNSVIKLVSTKACDRHGFLLNGEPKPYKCYETDSNYCIEIVRNEKGRWEGKVISTFRAYEYVKQYGIKRLRHPSLSQSGKPLVMRLMINDVICLEEPHKKIMRIVKMSGNGQITLADLHEANVDKRSKNKAKHEKINYCYARSVKTLQKAKARLITISPIGELHDPGFKDKL